MFNLPAHLQADYDALSDSQKNAFTKIVMMGAAGVPGNLIISDMAFGSALKSVKLMGAEPDQPIEPDKTVNHDWPANFIPKKVGNMIGISSSSKEQIAAVVEDMFDNIALQFIGDIPKLRHKKMITISSKPNFGLSHLFIQAMQNKTPNPIERDVLKSLLESAYGYVESLKNRTKSNVTERIDGLIKEAKYQNRKPDEKEIQAILAEELNKAKSHLKAIAESESTKLRNLGTMMDITRVSASLGDNDPTVFFVVVKDGVTCKECIKLHLMPDEITPRLWKFSELKQGYHKRGEDNPSAFGLHPHCRCTLTYLSSGYGFDMAGKVTYKKEDYNAFLKQRK